MLRIARIPTVPPVPIIPLQYCRGVGNVHSPCPVPRLGRLHFDTQVDQGLLRISETHRRLPIDEELVLRAAELQDRADKSVGLQLWRPTQRQVAF